MSHTILGSEGECRERWCRAKAILCVLRREPLVYSVELRDPEQMTEDVNLIHVQITQPPPSTDKPEIPDD